MRIYDSIKEEKLYWLKVVKKWFRSNLINKEQVKMFEERLNTNLKTTDPFFRILLNLFTLAFLASIVGFTLWLLEVDNEIIVSFILIIFGCISYFAGETSVKSYSFYRHGIEESFILGTVILFSIAASIILNNLNIKEKSLFILMCIFVSILCYLIYRRFGNISYVLISIGAISIIPFLLELAPLQERILLSVTYVLIIYLVTYYDKKTNYNFLKEDMSIVQACLLFLIYAIINLRIPDLFYLIRGNMNAKLVPFAGFNPVFYWISYLMIYIIPAITVYSGIKIRRKPFINTGLVMIILTISTNKDYLGLKHYSWDPIIFGIILISSSLLIIKWLSKGKQETRYGFTSRNILKAENYGIDIQSLGAILSMPVSQAGDTHQFSGGESGGGGVSRNF